MAEVEWIKIVTAFFDDDKITLIENTPEADMVLIIWIKLLCLAGKKNRAGYIFLTEKIPYTDEMLATVFNRPLNTVRLALATFKKLEMINMDAAGVIKITNWEKHQNIEGMERIRELARLRQAKKRKREKQILLEASNGTSRDNHDSRLDKTREDKNKEIVKVRQLIAASLGEKPKESDPLEFDFEEKCWWGLYDWRIKKYQGSFPRLTVNYLFNDKWKNKFLADPVKYKKMLKDQYNDNWENMIWAWLQQENKNNKIPI